MSQLDQLAWVAQIAGPAMVVELVSTAWLVKTLTVLSMLNLLSVLALWVITFFISVPAHNRLTSGFEDEVWRRLVTTNWLRTSLWTVRSAVLVMWMVYWVKF